MSALRTAVLMVSLLAAAGAHAEQPFAFDTTPGRLPKDVVPRSYEIRVRPDADKLTTAGSASIDIEVRRPVDRIVLNAFRLMVTQASLRTDPRTALAVSHDNDRQTVTLRAPRTLAPGTYRLDLEFTGRISSGPEGLHVVKYRAPSGPKVLLATHMEPVHARRLFPGFDEPAFRARFRLTAVVPPGQTAMSNTPIVRERVLDDGYQEISFAETPSMASYLVVLAIGEFEELNDRFDRTELRILTTEGKRATGAYALDATKKLLAYYNDYFGDKYPLPKLDQIALPGSIQGAMENWGGITYNESRLLYDPSASSFQTKRRVFGIVAHEISHQWFGNLVTMAWWDNLWLNEGFASWMAAKVTDRFNPEWGTWLRGYSYTEEAMSKDARKTTHPIQQPVADEAQAVDVFDEITYGKGQAFLRMLESYLGEEIFRAGIRKYIAAHRYSNTTTADLWAALEQASGKPVRALAAGWTEQSGLPVVRVDSTCGGGKRRVRLQQQRFTLNDPSAAPIAWKIPVVLADGVAPEKVVLLDKPANTFDYGACAGVLRANAGNLGYYRVEYAAPLFAELKAHINELPVADRLKLLSDSWALVEAARVPATTYLELVASLKDEQSLYVWGQVLDVLTLIDHLQRGAPGRNRFRAYARALLQPQLQRLGWDASATEDIEAAQLRVRIIATLGAFDDASVRKEAAARFEQFLARPQSLVPDLREPVLHTVGRYATPDVYQQLHTLARQALRTEDKQLYYRAMQSALDPALAKRTLAISLTDELPAVENTRNPAAVANQGEHAVLTWEFVQQNFAALMRKTSFYSRNYYVARVMDAFSDAARADELEAFVKANLTAAAIPIAARTADAMRHRAALKQRELPRIDEWIRKPPAG